MKMSLRPISQDLTRQRGIVSVAVVLFFITAVFLVVFQAFRTTETVGIDGVQQHDSVVALFYAESGVERVKSFLVDGVCADIPTVAASAWTGSWDAGQYSVLGKGSSYCGMGCTACSVESTGKYKSAVRTIRYRAVDTIEYGKASPPKASSVKMKLTNIYDVAAVGLYNVGILSHGAAGAITNCTYTKSDNTTASCNSFGPVWNAQAVNSGSEKNSDVGAKVALTGIEKAITFTFNNVFDYALVGGLFPALSASSAAPTVVGSYAKDTGTDGTKTVYGGVGTTDISTDGQTVGGVSGISDWCYGADTLVFGVTATANAEPNIIGQDPLIPGVVFNSSGSSPVSMKLLTYFPRETSAGPMYSKIFYRYNSLLGGGAMTVANASSYKAIGTGSIGAKFTGSIDHAFTVTGSISKNTNVLNVTSAQDYIGIGSSVAGARIPASTSILTQVSGVPGGVGVYTLSNPIGNQDAAGSFYVTSASGTYLHVSVVSSGLINASSGANGDYLVGSGISDNTRILSQLSLLAGQQAHLVGDYKISVSQTVGSMSMAAVSKILHITSCALCRFTVGSDIIGGPNLSAGYNPSISSQATGVSGGVGDYVLSDFYPVDSVTPSNSYAAGGKIRLGALGSVVYLTSSVGMPEVTNPPTVIALYSTGSVGVLRSGSGIKNEVTSVDVANQSFTLSDIPLVGLENDTICAGACAFFNNAANGGTTTFSVKTVAGTTTRWGGGFSCLKGVDADNIQAITGTATTNMWSEVVR